MDVELAAEVRAQMEQQMFPLMGALAALNEIIQAQGRLIELANARTESMGTELDALAKVIEALVQEAAVRKNRYN